MGRLRDPETRILPLGRLDATGELTAVPDAYTITVKSAKKPRNVSATRFVEISH
jgi:hypothetical protein